MKNTLTYGKFINKIEHYPYNGIVFNHKKEQNTDTSYNIDEPQKHAKKKKKCQLKKAKCK